MRKQQMLVPQKQLQRASLAGQTTPSLCTCQVPSSRSQVAQVTDDLSLAHSTLGTSSWEQQAKDGTESRCSEAKARSKRFYQALLDSVGIAKSPMCMMQGGCCG